MTAARNWAEVRWVLFAFLAGAALALVWAGVDRAAYFQVVGTTLSVAGHPISIRALADEVCLIPLFGLVMCHIRRGSLAGGAFSTWRLTATPALAALAALVVPFAGYVLARLVGGADPSVTESVGILNPGGVLPYCWLLACIVYGRRHATTLLVATIALLAELGGMLAFAAFHVPEMRPMWLGLVTLAMAFCQGLRHFEVRRVWPFLLAAPLSWLGLRYAGLDAAFAFVPLVGFMAHASPDGEPPRLEPLAALEKLLEPLIAPGLFLFALGNIGLLLDAHVIAPTSLFRTASLGLGGGLGVWFAMRLRRADAAAGVVVPRGITLPLLIAAGLTLASLVAANPLGQ